MSETPDKTIEPRDEWKETVRDISDKLVLSKKHLTELERQVLDLIETRHHDYFCVGKTMDEWESERDVTRT